MIICGGLDASTVRLDEIGRTTEDRLDCPEGPVCVEGFAEVWAVVEVEEPDGVIPSPPGGGPLEWSEHPGPDGPPGG